MKFLTFFLTFCILCLNGFSQDIEDVFYHISPKFTLSQDSLSEMYSDSTNLFFQVEISSISSVDEVYVNVGATNGGSNALSLTLDVVYRNSTYFLETGSYSFEVDNGYVILEVVSAAKDIEDFRFAEVWLKDNQQNISTKSKTTLP